MKHWQNCCLGTLGGRAAKNLQTTVRTHLQTHFHRQVHTDLFYAQRLDIGEVAYLRFDVDQFAEKAAEWQVQLIRQQIIDCRGGLSRTR